MRSSDEKQAREEETIGEPVGSGHASRKGRLTPRQLWARQERGRTKGQASEKPQAAKKGRSKAAEAEAAALGEDEKAYEEPFYEGPVLEESVEAGAEETGVVEEPADKREPVMVDPSMQPGAMDYPYATHRLAPDTREGELASVGFEKRVSSGFIIGVLIIVVALITGLSIVSQHKRISTLEERIRALEEAVPSTLSTLVVGR